MRKFSDLNSKVLLTALILLLLLLIITASTVSAVTVDGFLAESRDGVLFFYEYKTLLDSYALKVIGLSMTMGVFPVPV